MAARQSRRASAPAPAPNAQRAAAAPARNSQRAADAQARSTQRAPAAPAHGAQRAASPSAPRRRLLRRFVTGAALAGALLVCTLLCGVLGYRFVAGLSWLLAFHQASLLLAGMGPVVTDLSDHGRVFESFYAMFCGVVLLGSTGILFTPLIHHFLHAFHVEDSNPDR